LVKCLQEKLPVTAIRVFQAHKKASIFLMNHKRDSHHPLGDSVDVLRRPLAAGTFQAVELSCRNSEQAGTMLHRARAPRQ